MRLVEFGCVSLLCWLLCWFLQRFGLVNSFIPHRCHFTDQLLDPEIYIFYDLNIDLKVADIVYYIDYKW